MTDEEKSFFGEMTQQEIMSYFKELYGPVKGARIMVRVVRRLRKISKTKSRMTDEEMMAVISEEASKVLKL